MAVYTSVSETELRDFLTRYPLGDLEAFAGIRSGVTNTNCFVTTSRGEYVLTIFEQLAAHELPYFLELMAYLAEHGVPSPHPVADRRGRYPAELKGKPAALVQRLRGESTERPDPGQCEAVGAAMARIHLAGAGFPDRREDQHGPQWWTRAAARLAGRLEARERALLEDEIRFQASCDPAGLPRGVIHADLFRDNVLFEGNALSGIIDFYYACSGTFLYDVAIAVNDWCATAHGAIDPVRARAVLAGYDAVRPIGAREREAWPALLRAAALRWWVARLLELHFPRDGELTRIKDPEEFRVILERRREAGGRLGELFAEGGGP